MGFRDESVAARARIENLESELETARRELADARDGEPSKPAKGGTPSMSVVALGFALLLLVCAYFTGRAIPMLGLLLAVLGMFAFAFSIMAFIMSRLMVVVSPNELAVLSGRQYRRPDGSMTGYRLVRDGRVLRIPMLDRVDFMDLSNHAITLDVSSVPAKGNVAVHIEGSANVKIAGQEPLALHAVERFLGVRRAEISSVARQTVEGSLRAVVSRLTPTELRSDLGAVADRVIAEAEPDLSKLGLVLETLEIRSAADES